MRFYDICRHYDIHVKLLQCCMSIISQKNRKLKILYERLGANTDFHLPWATLTHEHKIVNIIYHGIEYSTNSIESRLTWNFILYNCKSIGKLQYL